jgi:hypothetical protein
MTDLSRVPGAQAVHLYGEMSETMAVCRFRLDEDDGGAGGGGGGDDRVAGVLETFLVSLSLLIGDDVTLRAGKGGSDDASYDVIESVWWHSSARKTW